MVAAPVAAAVLRGALEEQAPPSRGAGPLPLSLGPDRHLVPHGLAAAQGPPPRAASAASAVTPLAVLPRAGACCCPLGRGWTAC